MNSNPQLVIPMTGVGQRFINAGYSKLKPLIDTGQGTMIEGVLRNFSLIQDPLFVISKSHPQNEELKKELRRLRPHGRISEIASHKLGPSYAVWESREFIDLNKPVIVNYCDFSGIWSEMEFYEELSKVDGLICTYTGFHPHMIRNTAYAYVRKENGFVKEIQEKNPFTKNPMHEEASSGTYGFRSGKILLDAVREQIKDNLSLKGEFYTSLTYIPMLRNGATVKTYNISKFFQWGTPEDLEDFRFWMRLKNESKSSEAMTKQDSYSFSVILAGGRGSRLKDKSPVPKPQIKVFGRQLWSYAARATNGSKGTFVFTTIDQLEGMKQESVKDVVFLFTDKFTTSQTESAHQALKKLPSATVPVHILSSDVIFFKEELIKADVMLNECDVVIWTKRNYAASLKNPFHFSWVRVDNYGKVLDAYIKPIIKPESDEIIVGNFSFRDMSVAEGLISETLSRENSTGETYLDFIIFEAIQKGLKIRAISIRDFWSIGTEEEFETLRYWEDGLSYSEVMT